MKKQLIIPFLIFSTFIFAQKINTKCLVAFKDPNSELYGYKTQKGQVIITPKYSIASDTLCKMAFVLNPDSGFVGIDGSGKIIIAPFIYDNGPDYVKEGLFRFVENDKMGFANLDGVKVIKAKYSFVKPFENGISAYYIGGERIYENGQTKAEIIKKSGENGLADLHWTWGGKLTDGGFLNKSGEEFRRVTPLKNNKREAWTKSNKHVLLNQNGKITKIFPKKTKS